MKIFILRYMTLLIFSISISYAGELIMTSNDTKKFVKEAFTNTIENMDATEETYAKYFSRDYIQHVDGKTLKYDDFIAHMKAQKNVMKSATVNFKYMIVEGDKVATVHIVNGVKKNGGIIEAQVNALFQIKDKKIVFCDELTHLIKGDKSDRDLGSRH
jgi:predicted SnoaL-like aldol condensation-catalyzing enzyme